MPAAGESHGGSETGEMRDQVAGKNEKHEVKREGGDLVPSHFTPHLSIFLGTESSALLTSPSEFVPNRETRSSIFERERLCWTMRDGCARRAWYLREIDPHTIL